LKQSRENGNEAEARRIPILRPNVNMILDLDLVDPECPILLYNIEYTNSKHYSATTFLYSPKRTPTWRLRLPLATHPFGESTRGRSGIRPVLRHVCT